MELYRDFPSEFDSAADDDLHDGASVAIGTDERRMHVRAYNYWVSLLDGRDYPSIEDLEPGDLVNFAPHSVLLDFTSGRDNPATPYIGSAIREECDLPEDVQSIGDVPSRSLLSRLTDHYMQIIANRAPVGFEAEFENQRDDSICYRGILMPFSSDGDTIDFIYGVINWKKVGEESTAPDTSPAGLETTILEEFDEEPLELNDIVEPANDRSPPCNEDKAAFEPNGSVEVPMLSDAERAGQALADFDIGFAITVDDNAGLADRLWFARESADAVKEAEGRSREALYQALSRAYDFALAASDEPVAYAELLEESGVKAQARAPMTPIVKLVFGIDYDKSRLTEFATALAYADRQQIERGGFLGLIEAQPGGLKALVTAERKARRPEPKADTRTETAREQLRHSPAVTLADIRTGEEFALVLTRRTAAGVHEPVAIVDDEALVERAIRRAGA